MSLDAFIKFTGPDVKGDSVAKGHEGEIDVLSWSWGLAQTGTMHQSTGGGAGKVNVQDLMFTHQLDSASVNLVKFCSTGEHFEKVVLTLQKAGGKSVLPYMTLTLEKVLISSVSTGGSIGDERVIENVSLNFAKYTMMFQQQDDKGGKKGGAIETQYDIAKNY